MRMLDMLKGAREAAHHVWLIFNYSPNTKVNIAVLRSGEHIDVDHLDRERKVWVLVGGEEVSSADVAAIVDKGVYGYD
jgi:hypothetical protein